MTTSGGLLRHAERVNRHLLEAIIAGIVAIGCLSSAGMQREEMKTRLSAGTRRGRASAVWFRSSAQVLTAVGAASAVSCVFELARWLL